MLLLVYSVLSLLFFWPSLIWSFCQRFIWTFVCSHVSFPASGPIWTVAIAVPFCLLYVLRRSDLRWGQTDAWVSGRWCAHCCQLADCLVFLMEINPGYISVFCSIVNCLVWTVAQLVWLLSLHPLYDYACVTSALCAPQTSHLVILGTCGQFVFIMIHKIWTYCNISLFIQLKKRVTIFVPYRACVRNVEVYSTIFDCGAAGKRQGHHHHCRYRRLNST